VLEAPGRQGRGTFAQSPVFPLFSYGSGKWVSVISDVEHSGMGKVLKCAEFAGFSIKPVRWADWGREKRSGAVGCRSEGRVVTAAGGENMDFTAVVAI